MTPDAGFERGSRIGAGIAVALGILALVGWILDVEVMKRVLPNLTSMKANTAVSLVLLGVALWQISVRASSRWIPSALVLIAAAIAGLTLAEYATGSSFGLDELLFADDPGLRFGGRMAPVTAASFLTIGTAILLLLAQRARTAHLLGTVTFCVGLIAVLGYAFGVDSLHTLSNSTAIALHTSLGMCALALGVLATSPSKGLTAPFATGGVTGVMTRRILPAAVGVPIVAGWLIVQGERAHLYGSRFTTSITVVATVMLLGGLIWWAAVQLQHVDQQRAAAQDDLRQLNLELEERIDSRTAELSDSEERFRAVSESAADAVISSNDKGYIVYLNSAAARLFGYTPADLEGEPITVLMPERCRDTHREGISRFVSTGVAKLVGQGAVELVGLHSDGTEIPIELSLSSWTARGQTFVTGIIRNITERAAAQRVLEEREGFFRALSENVSDLIIRMSADGKITYASPAAKALLGYEPHEVIGRTALDLVPPEGRSEIQRVYGRVFNGESASMQQPVRRKDGSSVWVEGIASPTNDPETGVTSGIIWIVRDVSAHLADLEREREIAQQEHELNQLKNEFVGIVAHDLKSPMTVIGGFADIMVEQWKELNDEDKLEFLGRIRDNVSRLSTLVDDVLQVSRIESGELHLNVAPLDLGAFVTQTVEEIANVTPGRTIAVSVQLGLPQVVGDADRIWRVVSNVLSNAVKFSEAPTAVEVSVEHRGDEVEVSVRDRGHGIEQHDIDKLFVRFSRLQQPRGKAVKGTGLGLYISKQLIEAQGGRIWAESVPGAGTTVHFTVPVAGEQP
jgi:PAS domain S-box-containing protein